MAAPDEGALRKLGTVGLAERQGTHWDGSGLGFGHRPLCPGGWVLCPGPSRPPCPPGPLEQGAQSVRPPGVQASGAGWSQSCRHAGEQVIRLKGKHVCVRVPGVCQPVCAPGTEDRGPVSAFL